MSGDATRDSRPDVTVVVVTFRGAQWISECLASLAGQTLAHRLLVVDNASSDGTADVLRDLLPADQLVRLPFNAGFAGGVAAALPMVSTRFFALLNDDAIAAPDWLAELMAAAVDDPAAAGWTSLMLLADHPGRVNNLGAALDKRWYGVDVAAGSVATDIDPGISDSFGFSGGAALLRAAAVRAVGGFPADYFMYYEDLDTSWRLQLAGWAIRAVPSATVLHRHAASSDRRSEMFHFHNERNRLLTLLRCAPLPIALGQLARFVLTTGSLAATRLVGRGVPDHANFRIGLRVRVLASTLCHLPAVLGARPGTAAARRAVARRARTVP